MIKSRLLIRDVNQFLLDWAPSSLAESWDPIGLQVGSLGEALRGIVVSLDPLEAAIWESVEHEANLLVTHHPLFFKPISALTDRTPVMRAARLATQMGVNILSFHTNLDATQDGLNDRLAAKLGLKKIRSWLPSRDPRLPKLGLGRIGEIPATSLRDWLPKLARQLKIPHLRFVGDPKHRVQRVAVMTGSGGNYFSEAKAAGADCLVTGDVKYHAALDAIAEGICLIDVGHHAGEIEMVPLVAARLRAWLKKRKKNILVHETRTSDDPFQFYPGKK